MNINHEELWHETTPEVDPSNRPSAEVSARESSQAEGRSETSRLAPDSPGAENSGGNLERAVASLDSCRQRWGEISRNISEKLDSWERELAEAHSVIRAELRPASARCRRLLRLMRVFSPRKQIIPRGGAVNDVQSHR
jgi:hypothetical protein